MKKADLIKKLEKLEADYMILGKIADNRWNECQSAKEELCQLQYKYHSLLHKDDDRIKDLEWQVNRLKQAIELIISI